MNGKITLQGIKYDAQSSFKTGAAKAPELIRKALHSGSFNYYSELGVDTKSLFKDVGDYKIETYNDIKTITEKNLTIGHKMITLGGDHSITYPIIEAHSKIYPTIDILQIDAHGDLYDNFEGNKFSHACPFARIMENGLAKRLVQAGIRTLTPHQMDQSKKFGSEIHEMRNLDLSALKRFDNPLYISLDMDGFDPAFAPGVSHHEPGGLTSRQVLQLIQNLDATIIGADIVEYNPDRDHQDMTAYLAAKMLKEIAAKMI